MKTVVYAVGRGFVTDDVKLFKAKAEIRERNDVDYISFKTLEKSEYFGDAQAFWTVTADPDERDDGIGFTPEEAMQSFLKCQRDTINTNLNRIERATKEIQQAEQLNLEES